MYFVIESNQERPLSKADKETKRKANSFKRDPLSQTKLQSFFTPASRESRSSISNESDEDALVIDDNNDTGNDTLKLDDMCKLDNAEKVVSDHNDTTLKLEPVSESEEINGVDSDCLHSDAIKDKSNTKTFVINITLQGVPSKKKHTTEDTKKSNKEPHSKHSKSETIKDDLNSSQADNKTKDKKDIALKSPSKSPKQGKRKIKDLFGESDSDTEKPESKKLKAEDSKIRQTKKSSESDGAKDPKKPISEDRKHKHTKKQGDNGKSSQSDRDKHELKKIKTEDRSKRRSKKHDDVDRSAGSDGGKQEVKKIEASDRRKGHSKNHDLDADSSESDKESEVTKKNNTENKKKRHSKQHSDRKHHKKSENSQVKAEEVEEPAQNRLTLAQNNNLDSESENELVIDENMNSSSEGKEANSSANTYSQDISNNSSATTNSSNIIIHEEEDAKLDKAYQLSKEADKVLQALKMFAENPPEPVVVAEKSAKVEKPDKVDSPAKESSDLAKTSHTHHKHKSDHHRHHSKDRTKLSLSRSKEHRHNKERHKEKVINSEKEKSDKRVVKEEKKEKVDLAGLVVKLLMPYYKKKKIDNRDLFKITARHIVHQLIAIQVTGKY